MKSCHRLALTRARAQKYNTEGQPEFQALQTGSLSVLPQRGRLFLMPSRSRTTLVCVTTRSSALAPSSPNFQVIAPPVPFMLQWIFERLTMVLTALAPSSPNFQVLVPACVSSALHANACCHATRPIFQVIRER